MWYLFVVWFSFPCWLVMLNMFSCNCWLSVYLPWKNVQVFCPFLNRIVWSFFFFLLLRYMNSLLILDINYLSDIWFRNVFPQSIFCHLVLLMVSFALAGSRSHRNSECEKDSVHHCYFRDGETNMRRNMVAWKCWLIGSKEIGTSNLNLKEADSSNSLDETGNSSPEFPTWHLFLALWNLEQRSLLSHAGPLTYRTMIWWVDTV